MKSQLVQEIWLPFPPEAPSEVSEAVPEFLTALVLFLPVISGEGKSKLRIIFK